jgi:hypothetical protein
MAAAEEGGRSLETSTMWTALVAQWSTDEGRVVVETTSPLMLMMQRLDS